MKRGFVRTLWGVFNDPRRLFECRPWMDTDIELLKLNKYECQLKPIYYVFGEDNYKFLQDLGFNSVLVDKRPIVWGENESMFRHKLEVYKLAAQNFDEFVFLDLDCMLVKPLPDDFWEVCKEKQPLQSSLMIYHRRKARWRKIDARKIPCACYVYFREKHLPEEMIQCWETMPQESEEVACAKLMDEMVVGWKGLDFYWKNFEPDFYAMSQNIVFDPKNYPKKCFHHFHERNEVKYNLRLIKKGQKPSWAV